MTEKFDIPHHFSEILKTKFDEALVEGEILFIESENEYKTIDDVNYCITLLKSLTNRPVKGTRENNPFLKTEPKLTILENYGESYKVIYNKFPVVREHFMMVTKNFVSQNTPLSPVDLMGIFNLVKEADRQTGERHFGFFNCGPNSGASQPHKHIQFIKLPNHFIPFPDFLCNGVDPFVPDAKTEPLQNKNLPFAHFVAPLPRQDEQIDEDVLGLYYISLLQRALTIMRTYDQSELSYNFIMTRKWMMVVPRSHSIYKEKIGFNSTAFLGLLLAKNEELHKLILKDGPFNILREIGFPNTAGEGSDEYHY